MDKKDIKELKFNNLIKKTIIHFNQFKNRKWVVKPSIPILFFGNLENYKNSKLKIIHVTNFNQRYFGRLQYNTGIRINNGLIRLGHNVISLSDRDLINISIDY